MRVPWISHERGQQGARPKLPSPRSLPAALGISGLWESTSSLWVSPCPWAVWGSSLLQQVHKQTIIFKRTFQNCLSPPCHPVDLSSCKWSKLLFSYWPAHCWYAAGNINWVRKHNFFLGMNKFLLIFSCYCWHL